MNATKEATLDQLAPSSVICERKNGLAWRGTPLRFGPRVLAFEVYHPDAVFAVSDVLPRITVNVRGNTIYSGRALITSVVQTEGALICEAQLDSNWLPHPSCASVTPDSLEKCFREFLDERKQVRQIRSDYKSIVTDIQIWLTEARLWLGQIELASAGPSRAKQNGTEIGFPTALFEAVLPTLNELFDRFESISGEISGPSRTAHQVFVQRQLHPFLLCSPFLYRTYAKPLGFAGDYEMINMIIRHRPTGNSLFAKLVDAFLLEQGPPRAVRSRVGYLADKIVEETHRVSRTGRRARIYSLGCGPAREVEQFVSKHPFAPFAEFRLLDFNDETLNYVRNWVAPLSSSGSVTIDLVKNSVQALLKSGARRSPGEPTYDLIYCSGLYDYLGDRVCQSLNNYLYDRLSPGGKLVIGNFAPWTPRRYVMEDLAEWFLIYRDVNQVRSLAPEGVRAEDCAVWAEPTGFNIFLEARKSE